MYDHLQEYHPEADVFERFEAWRHVRPKCTDCDTVIDFSRTWTDQNDIHLAPSFCGDCQKGLLMLAVQKIEVSG